MAVSMKNRPTPAEDRPPELSPAWREALTLLDSDLRRRGAAEKTRRAYRTDIGQFARWCAEQGLDPKAAAAKAVLLLTEKGRSTGGIILVDNKGRVGYARNTERMPVAWAIDAAEIMADS